MQPSRAWVATGLTLFIFSFLYKDNPLFKLAENLYVGVSVGYTIVKTYDTVIVHLIWKPIVEKGEMALLIPVAIGLLMLTRYVPKAAWMSRYAFAFIVGVGIGAGHSADDFLLYLQADRGYGPPVVDRWAGDGLTFTLSLLNPASSLNAIIILIGVSSVLFYFFFSVEHTGRASSWPDRDPLSDDRVRRGVRLYRDGPHVALDRPIDRPHRILRSLLRSSHLVAADVDHRAVLVLLARRGQQPASRCFTRPIRSSSCRSGKRVRYNADLPCEET